jgi:hypothetical protein
MIKKMTLLAMVIGALMVFHAPLTASASTWNTNGVPLGESEEEGDEVHFTGTLSFTNGPVKISCDATIRGVLWNAPGAIGRATISRGPDPTPTGGCTVAVFSPPIGGHVDLAACHVNPSSEGENWPITTSGEEVAIAEANFTDEFVGEQCLTVLGIPSGTKINSSGIITGRVSTGCIVYNNSGHLSEQIKLDGQVCPTLEGLGLTSV